MYVAKQRQHLNVRGVVQGVGFRPFVYGLATELGLSGFVGNHSDGVFIEIEGPPELLNNFRIRLQADAPPLAVIEEIVAEDLALTGHPGFTIVKSQVQSEKRTFVSPDLCICDDCLQELFDPTNRRYLYPFINCTNCGPRFTITKDIPYDRPLTTMAGFAMCSVCQAEYENPLDRRFHAQPNACEDCGPRVWFKTTANGQQPTVNSEWSKVNSQKPTAKSQRSFTYSEQPSTDAMHEAQDAIRAGRIVAIKGLGGFHLACDATNDAAVAELRKRKGRVDKPFAVMVADLQTARQLAHISQEEAAQLTDRVRPVVLLRKREDSLLSNLVAPGNHFIGIMLPYTPLHYLLFHSVSAVKDAAQPPCNFLVMTSGNLSSEPIVIDNDEAVNRLSRLADAFLFHDRPIHVPCDDSVVRVLDGGESPIRRSRGYAPFPVKLPFEVQPTLAVGGELKSTFCLADERYGFMSQHIGDMENLETLRAFESAVEHFCALFRTEPALLVCDMHPGYLSTKWAESTVSQSVDLVKVQHHHAHIAAVMAENGMDGKESVIGFSFDGTGYGADGAIWGGEVLVADYAEFRRAAYLDYVPLPGGDAAVRNPSRMALAHLWAAGIPWDEQLPAVVASTTVERNILQKQLERSLNTALTSSMGRLFDAVAALAGVRQCVTYEGQAAIEFEALSDPNLDDVNQPDAYAFAWAKPQDGGPIRFVAAQILQAVVADVRRGVPASVISARFHRAVVQLIVDLSLHLREQNGLNYVALSGGVFQNILLLKSATVALRRAGFDVLTHRKVPANDGGLALGQVVIAHAQQGN